MISFPKVKKSLFDLYTQIYMIRNQSPIENDWARLLNYAKKLFIRNYNTIFCTYIQKKEFLRKLVQKRLIDGSISWNGNVKIRLSTFFQIDNIGNVIDIFINNLISYYQYETEPIEILHMSRNSDIKILLDIIKMIFSNPENVLYKELVLNNWRNVGFKSSINHSIDLLIRFKNTLIALHKDTDGWTFGETMFMMFQFEFRDSKSISDFILR